MITYIIKMVSLAHLGDVCFLKIIYATETLAQQWKRNKVKSRSRSLLLFHCKLACTQMTNVIITLSVLDWV